MIPCCRIESMSSCNASCAKSLRGCNGLGTMLASLIWWTLSPGSAASVRATAAGVPINAPRPLPRPDRAMRQRLREQPDQRKRQSASLQWPEILNGRATRRCPWPIALGCFQLATLDFRVSGVFATRASRTAREACALPRGRQSGSRLSPKKF